MFELITTILLILASLLFSLALLGYAARQWRKLKRGK